MTLLDLFFESGSQPALHYAITALQFVPAVYLASYQIVRIRCLRRYRGEDGSGKTLHVRKPRALLVLALLSQLYVLVVSGLWFDIRNDVNSDELEWTVFAVILLFNMINPATFSSVARVAEEADVAATGRERKRARMGPVATTVSVFRNHFMRQKLLVALCTLASFAQAILTAYEGAQINELTKMVTRMEVDPQTGVPYLAATEQEVTRQGGILIGVWAGAHMGRFLFDVISARLFSKLEVWLRGTVFEKAMEASSSADSDESVSDTAAKFGATYASDVTGVVSLYGTLLRGIIMNLLLISANFVFLVIYNWQVAIATLGFLACALTSGPTDIATSAAIRVQKETTEGLGLVGEGVRSSGDGTARDAITQRHRDEVLAPLERSLSRNIFYTNAVDLYINFFSSFMTVVIVITMTYSVYIGEMDSSDFLGVFFVYKELQKPAMKMSGVLKKLINSSAKLGRLNDTLGF